ncbi:ATP-binding cassette domain-containing protein [Granulicella sp. S190]|uniref:ATP-binding cassette domain-containing protein n=1 Tax=Granulicella sp. S190 TaxID=1747226 RepID=UPI00131E6D02|nr:ATP-binding cassette domain-containing protein [Granulicella sp. S190]
MKHRVGAVSLDVDFALSKPWTVLFGSSGSGKTTVLRAIAGFLRPDAGSIVIGERVLVDRASRVFVPAALRPMRTAGQTARLFPHMSVRSNVIYGIGPQRHEETNAIVAVVMEMFRLSRLLDRMPHELSGGERQRASVARAVISAATYTVPETVLLLLDEPFSGLDYARRDDLVAELREFLRQRKIPVLSVTHDVGEAFQLGAEVIKLAEGRVMQQGPAVDVLQKERMRLREHLG